MTLHIDPAGRSLGPGSIAARLDECFEVSGVTPALLSRFFVERVASEEEWFQPGPRKYGFYLIQDEAGALQWVDPQKRSSLEVAVESSETVVDFALIDNFRLLHSRTLPFIEKYALETGKSCDLLLVAPYLLQSELTVTWTPSDLYLAIARDNVVELRAICDARNLNSEEMVTGPVYDMAASVQLSSFKILEFCVVIGSDACLYEATQSLKAIRSADLAEALKWAIIMHNREAVEFLVRYNEIVDYLYESSGCRPLHIAAKNDNFHACVCLIEAGCDQNVINAERQTAEDLAREEENAEISALFKQK